MTDAWPLQLTAKQNGRILTIRFDDGSSFDLDAEYLRVESPSAEVKGHGPGQEQLVSGKRQIFITKLEPVGTYAVRIIFSDGHSTGLYTWTYLAKLGQEYTTLWPAYLEKLKQAGVGRG